MSCYFRLRVHCTAHSWRRNSLSEVVACAGSDRPRGQLITRRVQGATVHCVAAPPHLELASGSGADARALRSLLV